jgi:hypothetical protein
MRAGKTFAVWTKLNIDSTRAHEMPRLFRGRRSALTPTFTLSVRAQVSYPYEVDISWMWGPEDKIIIPGA